MFSLGAKKTISFIFIGVTLLLSVHVTKSAPSNENGGFLQETQIANGSSDGNACSSNPCLRGTCLGNGTEYHCFCPSGFTGKICETTVDACYTKPCLRGKCLHHDGDYYCVCPSGYTGKNCDSTINACQSNPCERGVCYHYQTQFRCVCPPGFYGERCEIDNNECFSQPCLNGGICVDGIADFSCVCLSGFAGELCQTDVDECSSSPCLNGGVCADGINGFVCRCPLGFGGKRCQNVTDPCRYNPCTRGTCFAHSSQFICECPSGYTGDLCDTKIQLTLKGPKEVFINLPAGNHLNLDCSVSSERYRTYFQWSKIRGSLSSHSRSSVYTKSHTDIGDVGIYICKVEHEPSVLKVFHVDITWHSETCDFDDGALCGWNNHGSGISWSLQHGKIQSSDPAECNDHTVGTSDGRYMLIDATSHRHSDVTAFFKSHVFPANRTVCFIFWYQISGSGNGILSVILKDTRLKKETVLLNFTEYHGRKWNKATVTVSHSSIPNDYIIVLKAEIRRSFKGYMAVDDLKISDGLCQD